MNDKDKEAFNVWRNSTSTRLDIHDAWQAACEFKQEEIETVELREIKVNRSFVELADKYCELQAENKKLREALEYIQSNTESSYIFNWAEEALKKE